MRLIDADKIEPHEHLESFSNNHAEYAMVAYMDDINALPTVDAVQVVHGRWIDETFAPWGLVHHPYKCDQCGDHSEAPSNYCPNCGAIMDGKDGDGNG